MSIFDDLVRKGYFPKELPPVFTTKSFAELTKDPSFDHNTTLVAPNSKGNLASPDKGLSKHCKHNLARLDESTRSLQIPHPVHYFHLCRVINDNWSMLEIHLKGSSLSISAPKLEPKSIRAFLPRYSGAVRPLARLRDRAQGNVALVTDVTNFYGTLYTHSIPWALHGKSVAKKDRSANSLFGNAIDTYMRNAQDGQTLGVPVGTDTSFIIAEAILTKVDAELKAKFPELVGHRYYDDYELVCKSESDAQAVLYYLEQCLQEYSLSTNKRKTKIVNLPTAIEHHWLTKVRQFALKSQFYPPYRQIQDFANYIFPIAEKYDGDPVLKYAVLRIAKELDIDGRSWAIYQNILISILRSAPQVSGLVMGEILHYHGKKDFKVDTTLLESAINSNIERYLAIGAHNEVAWSLWIAVKMKLKVADALAVKLATTPDNFVALLTLDAQSHGVFSSKIDTSYWESKLTESEIYSENWLLVYEAAAKGWLKDSDGSDYINKHQCLSKLNKNKVTFFDNTWYATSPELIKRLRIDTEIYSA